MIDEERVRLQKLEALRQLGLEPYPTRVERSHSVAHALADFTSLEKSGREIKIVGRLRSIRIQGKAGFAHLEDATGRIQMYCKSDILGVKPYQQFKNYYDVGDLIQVSGTVFVTHKGEKTIQAWSVTMLAKTLLPLPEKWHGLSDVETRYRQRYLDLLANPEVKNVFLKRSLMITALREFLNERGFLEVETPVLQPLAGGATARPFITHHHALDIDLYLRVAPELYLKRLLIGGFEKVYEIARCFRNEGIDFSHNPEFTQVEFYAAYEDYQSLMALTEELLITLARRVTGGLAVQFEGQEISFVPPYPRLKFRDALLQYAEIDIEKLTDVASLAREAKKRGLVMAKSDGYGKICDELYKKFVRPKLIQPTFIIDHPVELSPLAKQRQDNPRFVERFQLIVGGTYELCNAFSELNDPLEQASRFKVQEELRLAGDEEAQPADQDFVTALKYGLPPSAGFGMGLDRLANVLTGTHSLKESILFPTLRPKIGE